jgi:hypothetical protein
VKSVELDVVPSEFVTLMGPVVAPTGTLVVIWVSESTVNVADVPLKSTAVVPLKFDPVIVTVVATGPLVGLNDVIDGRAGPGGALSTVKSAALIDVPAAFSTLIGPVSAPVGTLVSIRMSDTTVKLAAVPSNATADVPVKPVPSIVTAVPIGPLVGLKELMLGATITVKLVELNPVP